MKVSSSDAATFDELPRLGAARDPLEGVIADAREGDPYAIDELYAVWRGARDDQTIAFVRWRSGRDQASYAAYLAAADRADIAQDVLAACLG